MRPQEDERIEKDDTHCPHCGIGPFTVSLEEHVKKCDYNAEYVIATLEAEAKAIVRIESEAEAKAIVWSELEAKATAIVRSESEAKATAEVHSDPLEEARFQNTLRRSIMGKNDVCNNDDATRAFDSNLPIYGPQTSESSTNGVESEQEHPQASNKEAVQERPQEEDKEAVQERPQEVEKEAVQERPQEVEKEAVQERPQEVEKEAVQGRPQEEDNEAVQSEEKDESYDEESASSIGSYSSDDFVVDHHNCDGTSSYEANSTEEEDEDEDTSEHEEEYSEDESLLSIAEETEVANMKTTRSQRPRRSCTAKMKNTSEENHFSDGTDMVDDYETDEYNTSESEINSEDSVLSEDECDNEEGRGDGSEDSATGAIQVHGTTQKTRSGGQLSDMRQTTIDECRPFSVGKDSEK